MGEERVGADAGFAFGLFLVGGLNQVPSGPVSLDEGVWKAFDGHRPGQAGLTQVGGTPPLQLPLTSEQSQAAGQM